MPFFLPTFVSIYLEIGLLLRSRRYDPSLSLTTLSSQFLPHSVYLPNHMFFKRVCVWVFFSILFLCHLFYWTSTVYLMLYKRSPKLTNIHSQQKSQRKNCLTMYTIIELNNEPERYHTVRWWSFELVIWRLFGGSIDIHNSGMNVRHHKLGLLSKFKV